MRESYWQKKTNLSKLQRVQKSLAKVVLNKKWPRVSSTEAFKTLHWLPVKQRIQFKVASLTNKVLLSHEPNYLANQLHTYVPCRSLRSSDTGQLVIPRFNTVAGSFSFQCYAPTLWNSIPLPVRNTGNVLSFNKALKTHFFNQAFPV